MNTWSPWDLTVLSFQATLSTNAITIVNYSLLSSPANSKYRINKGEFERYAKENFNLHLLNTRIALNRKSSIAFGMNVRGYTDMKSSKYNFADTLKVFRNFLKINEKNTDFEAKVKSSNWLEIFATYSRTLFDNETRRLNGGITVKGSRGLAGIFAGLQQVAFTRGVVNNKPFYYAKSGTLEYGYSSTMDKWKKGNSSSRNLNDLVLSSQGGGSIDLGVEYMVKSQSVTNYNDEDNYYDYDWKIGVSLLDLGITNYRYGSQSRSANGLVVDISDTSIQRKFSKVKSVQEMNDSLGTIFTNLQPLTGKFSIINPVRLVINVDRYLFGDFYINGEVSANLASLASADKLYSSEISMLTVTPRWETRRYGAYLPVQLNNERQFWIGAAVKAGPVLLGVHNLANIFSTKKMQNGGGYLAFVIRPGGFTKAHRDKQYDCPQY